MTKTNPVLIAMQVLLLAGAILAHNTQAADPLPSWNKGASKSAIIDYVDSVTKAGSATFIPVPQRIATFDNDGCLWSEQPVYFQVLYAMERLREMAPDHPEWQNTEPFQSALADGVPGLMASGMQGISQVLAATHANITATAFDASVRDWLATARHPQTGLLYTQMVYQPMLDLLAYLRENEFKTYIVSGGGIDFVRTFSEQAYGIPPEQIVGTTFDAEFQMLDGIPTIIKTPKLMLLDDKAGKPVGIYQHIGRRPIFAAGNSDGDLQMLQYTTIARSSDDTTPRFGLIVHHTDAEREWAYDRSSHIGKLDKALDQAKQQGWIVVDMKDDWRQIYPEAKLVANNVE